VAARSAVGRGDRAAPEGDSRDAEDTPRNAGVGASLAAEHRITGCSTEANNSALTHATEAGIATIGVSPRRWSRAGRFRIRAARSPAGRLNACLALRGTPPDYDWAKRIEVSPCGALTVWATLINKQGEAMPDQICFTLAPGHWTSAVEA
jgi:hypothetical protein